jgi:uncharacterized membrane protein
MLIGTTLHTNGTRRFLSGVSPGDEPFGADLSPEAQLVGGGVVRVEETRAVIWTDLVPAPRPAEGFTRSSIVAISDDGRVAVGVAWNTGSPTETAVVWRDGVPELLAQGFEASSRAVGVSGDGRIVLVHVFLGSNGPPYLQHSFLWDEANGLRPVFDVLRFDFRLASAFASGEASAISRDGTTLVGVTEHSPTFRQGWVARIAHGCSNGLDDDADGAIDLADGGCADADDYSERGPGVACDDGTDNEGDGVADFPDDPSCASPAGTTKATASTGSTTTATAGPTTRRT